MNPYGLGFGGVRMVHKSKNSAQYSSGSHSAKYRAVTVIKNFFKPILTQSLIILWRIKNA